MFGTSIIRHFLLENRYQKEITEKHYRAYVKSRENEMISRQERIKEVIYKNRNEPGYKSSSLYAEAFVDGQIEAEKEQTQKFYNKVMSADENERRVIMICGRPTSEVAKALEFYDKRKNEERMTREEAIRIVRNNVFGLTDTGQAEKWISTLQALGLIKFDEPEIKCPAELTNLMHDKNKSYYNHFSSIAPIDIVHLIDQAGYKLVRK